MKFLLQAIISTVEERILKVTKKSGNRGRCRKLSLWNWFLVRQLTCQTSPRFPWGLVLGSSGTTSPSLWTQDSTAFFSFSFKRLILSPKGLEGEVPRSPRDPKGLVGTSGTPLGNFLHHCPRGPLARLSHRALGSGGGGARGGVHEGPLDPPLTSKWENDWNQSRLCHLEVRTRGPRVAHEGFNLVLSWRLVLGDLGIFTGLNLGSPSSNHKLWPWDRRSS